MPRITIVLDSEVIKKLRTIQAEQIKNTAAAASFSSIINDTLKKCLKNETTGRSKSR